MKKLAMICGIALIGASVSVFAGGFNTQVVDVEGDTTIVNPIIVNPRVSVLDEADIGCSHDMEYDDNRHSVQVLEVRRETVGGHGNSIRDQ